MTLQEKIDKLIPYIGEKFIELDFEYDFSPLVRFHYFFDSEFEVPKEFSDFIDVESFNSIKSFDFDLAKKKFGDEWIGKIIESPETFEKESGRIIYQFIAGSRLDETGEYRTRDTIDYVLDKVIEFLEYLDNKKNEKNDKSSD